MAFLEYLVRMLFGKDALGRGEVEPLEKERVSIGTAQEWCDVVKEALSGGARLCKTWDASDVVEGGRWALEVSGDEVEALEEDVEDGRDHMELPLEEVGVEDGRDRKELQLEP